MKSHQIALVITVPTRDCALCRIRNLTTRLGPIMARSPRQSTRLANTLRAGYPVSTFEELAPARVVLLCLAEGGLAEVLDGLISARFSWRGKSVLLYGPVPDSAALSGLAERGAAVASLAAVTSPDDFHYLVEGDKHAVREARRLVEGGGGRVLVVQRSSQALCAAGASLASWLVAPLIDASVSCFRDAGLTPRRAGPLAEGIVERTLRAYLKGGRRAWKCPSSPDQRKVFLRQLRAVGEADPALAEFLLETARHALCRMGRDTSWLEQVSFSQSRAAAAASAE